VNALGSNVLHLAARPLRAPNTGGWSLEVGDDLAMDGVSVESFNPAVFKRLVSPLCLGRPNFFDLFRGEFVEALEEFLGQLGALIERQIQHLFREFVEIFHISIVPVA